MTGTQRPHLITPQLRQIRAQAKANPEQVFTSLIQHVDFDLLREAYHRLRRDGAPGLSGIDTRDY
jgi:hypothetical protein